jgi:hypothetical protein
MRKFTQSGHTASALCTHYSCSWDLDGCVLSLTLRSSQTRADSARGPFPGDDVVKISNGLIHNVVFFGQKHFFQWHIEINNNNNYYYYYYYIQQQQQGHLCYATWRDVNPNFYSLIMARTTMYIRKEITLKTSYIPICWKNEDYWHLFKNIGAVDWRKSENNHNFNQLIFYKFKTFVLLIRFSTKYASA